MAKKILALLPESIGGRLTMTSLFKGFEQCGFDVQIIDILNNAQAEIKKLNPKNFEYLVSYDFTGIKFKCENNLDIKTINYFSDVIESDCSGPYWQQYYDQLKDENNYVFYWDKKLTQKAKEKGEIKNIEYLAHAVDTKTYKNLKKQAQYDVMFAGRLTYGTRCERFLKLVKSLPNLKFALYCIEKHLNQACEKLSKEDAALLRSIYKGFIDTEEKMNEAINKAKIVINFTSQGESSLNYRCFQVLACEKILLTDKKSEFEEIFGNESKILEYENDDQLCEKIKDVFDNPPEYKTATIKCKQIIDKHHSAKAATQEIIEKIDAKKEKKGFTLAEVLIVIGVVGIIATVMFKTIGSNIQDHELKNSLKSIYSDFYQATSSIKAENGDTMAYLNSGTNANLMAAKYQKYMSTIKTCAYNDVMGKCWHQSGVMAYIDGTRDSNTQNTDFWDVAHTAGFILKNGAYVIFTQTQADCKYGTNLMCGEIVLDVNGAKAPNRIGRDIYLLYIKEEGIKPWGYLYTDAEINTRCNKNATGAIFNYACAAKYIYKR